MKIDSAIREFSEKYNIEAMQSIDEISKELGLNYNKKNHINSIRGFTIKEGFDSFIEFIHGYAKYKVDNIMNERATSHETILNHTKSFIQNKVFTEKPLLYSELPIFVESYISGVKSLQKVTDATKTQMMEAGVDTDSIASINDFMDMFMTRLNESFDPVMNQILWASGYYGKIRLANQGQKVFKPVIV